MTEKAVPLSTLQYRIINLAWPVMLSNITVPLLSLVDTAVLGHLPDPWYLGAVSVAGQLFTLMLWSFGFLRMGTTALTAYSKGASGQTEENFRHGLIMALIVAVPLMPSAMFLAPYMVEAMGASALVAEHATEYLTIRLYAVPAVLIQYVILGWFIGRGNTRVPLALLIMSNSINAILDLWFVYGLGMTSDGVALATVIADYSALFVGLFLVTRAVRQETGRGLALYWDGWEPLKPVIRVNRELFVRTLCLLLVFVFFISRGAQQGDLILAVNAIMLTVLLFISNALDGFAHAAEALIGQSKGAKDGRQARQVVWLTGADIFLMALLLTAVFALGGHSLIGLLTDQAPVMTLSSEYIVWLICLPLVGFSSYWLDGVFIGCQETAAMRNSMLLAAGVIFVPVWFLTQGMGNHGLWLAFYAFLLARSVFMAPAFLTILKGFQISAAKN